MEFPSRNVLKQLSRRQSGNVVPEPLRLQKLVLPEYVTKLDDGTEFLGYDSGNEREVSMIIF